MHVIPDQDLGFEFSWFHFLNGKMSQIQGHAANEVNYAKLPTVY